MPKANQKIRDLMYITGVKQWEVARAIGCHESVLCRDLREELPSERKKEIIAAIERLKK